MAEKSREYLDRKQKDNQRAEANRQRQVRLGHILETADEVLTTPPAERKKVSTPRKRSTSTRKTSTARKTSTPKKTSIPKKRSTPKKPK